MGKNPTEEMDLVDSEEIKKRWKKYTVELYRKDLYELDDCDGVVKSTRATHSVV